MVKIFLYSSYKEATHFRREAWYLSYHAEEGCQGTYYNCAEILVTG